MTLLVEERCEAWFEVGSTDVSIDADLRRTRQKGARLQGMPLKYRLFVHYRKPTADWATTALGH